MWMTDYIQAIKRQLRDVYSFTPLVGSTDDEPLFADIPDGEYPMEINGKTDRVRIKSGSISCGNFV